jgi:hypothetical protein
LAANVIDQPAAALSIPFRPGAVRSHAAKNLAQDGMRFRWQLRSMASLAAAAAVILAILTVYRWPGRDQNGNGPGGAGVASASGWGWNRPDALPQDLARDAYLNHLADGAQAWFNKRPADRAALIQRIAEFRQGCTVLLQSPHNPLPAGDHAWLIERCIAWAAKLGTFSAALESEAKRWTRSAAKRMRRSTS